MGDRALCVPYRPLDPEAEDKAFLRQLEEGEGLQPWSSQGTLTLVVPAGGQHSRAQQSWELLQHSGNNFLEETGQKDKEGKGSDGSNT